MNRQARRVAANPPKRNKPSAKDKTAAPQKPISRSLECIIFGLVLSLLFSILVTVLYHFNRDYEFKSECSVSTKEVDFSPLKQSLGDLEAMMKVLAEPLRFVELVETTSKKTAVVWQDVPLLGSATAHFEKNVYQGDLSSQDGNVLDTFFGKYNSTNHYYTGYYGFELQKRSDGSTT